MKGIPHSVFSVAKGVDICNIEDTYYGCVFETWAELREFIKELEDAGRDAFGAEQERTEEI